MFLNPRSHDFYVDWQRIADNTVAILRGAAGRNPHDKTCPISSVNYLRVATISARGGQLTMRLHRTGVKKIHHPVVGDLELTYEGMELPADPGLTMFVYTAEPASPSEDGLKLLASWAATEALVESEFEAQTADSTRVLPLRSEVDDR